MDGGGNLSPCGKQPPSASETLTLAYLVTKILNCNDMSDYEKANLLSNALQHYQSWSSQESTQRNDNILWIDQLLPLPIQNVIKTVKPLKRPQPTTVPAETAKRASVEDLEVPVRGRRLLLFL